MQHKPARAWRLQTERIKEGQICENGFSRCLSRLTGQTDRWVKVIASAGRDRQNEACLCSGIACRRQGWRRRRAERMERNVKTEQGQTEGMKKDDWSRWIQRQRESEKKGERREKKLVVILRILLGLVPRRWRGAAPPPFFLPETVEGYARGDASRMLIRQNANWKKQREKAVCRPPPASAGGRSLKCWNQVVIVPQLNPAKS